MPPLLSQAPSWDRYLTPFALHCIIPTQNIAEKFTPPHWLIGIRKRSYKAGISWAEICTLQAVGKDWYAYARRITGGHIPPSPSCRTRVLKPPTDAILDSGGVVYTTPIFLRDRLSQVEFSSACYIPWHMITSRIFRSFKIPPTANENAGSLTSRRHILLRRRLVDSRVCRERAK